MQLSCECIACLNQFGSRLTSSVIGYTTLHHICQQIGGKRAAGTIPSDLLYMNRAHWDASKMLTTQPPDAAECSSARSKGLTHKAAGASLDDDITCQQMLKQLQRNNIGRKTIS